MELGVYTAVLHDRPLPEALTTIRSLGLTGAEVNAGGRSDRARSPDHMLLSSPGTPGGGATPASVEGPAPAVSPSVYDVIDSDP